VGDIVFGTSDSSDQIKKESIKCTVSEICPKFVNESSSNDRDENTKGE